MSTAATKEQKVGWYLTVEMAKSMLKRIGTHSYHSLSLACLSDKYLTQSHLFSHSFASFIYFLLSIFMRLLSVSLELAYRRQVLMTKCIRRSNKEITLKNAWQKTRFFSFEKTEKQAKLCEEKECRKEKNGKMKINRILWTLTHMLRWRRILSSKENTFSCSLLTHRKANEWVIPSFCWLSFAPINSIKVVKCLFS